ncbi:flagellar filament capping protein FliD [Herbiconiux sp. SYSU D00978]|uniref:flagellar filament capping protein FliD n=1 Tax=Herbiconiux sp. SYSU D00978 TaxID=2812562 RepID=UPI001A96CA49|nr:flagellar filament capping protein FliD [Herbiconiux sp. SYSU D00978]
MVSLDGIASGLDTTALIDSLMAVEAIPRTILTNKVSSTQTLISALQTLNTRVASVTTTAENLAKAGSLALTKGTSTDDSIAVATKQGAAPGSMAITVDAVAARQVSVSKSMTSWGGDSTLDITRGGTTQTIALDPTSIDSVVKSINDSATAGITALKVRSGTAADGTAQYRIQLSSKDTGAAATFTTSLDTDLVTAASDAQLTLWADSPDPAVRTTITSSTNTFAEVLPNVDITVSKKTTAAATIAVSSDVDAQTAAAKKLVDDINSVFSLITANSTVTSTTSSTGASSTKAGIFTGDSTARSVRTGLTEAISYPVNDRSPSEIGIELQRDGTIKFDDAAFKEALAKDPAAVQSTLSAIAARVQKVGDAASDKFDGTITGRITGQQNLVKSLGDQVLSWDDRLASRRSTLERTYAQLEVQLSNLQSQQTWLQGQLATLGTNNTGAKK